MAQTTPKHDGYTIINGTTTGSNGSKVNTWLEYKVTQSITNNTSTIDIYLYARATQTLSTKWEVSTSYGSITFNGTAHAGATMQGGYDFTSTSKYNEFAHYNTTVTHNSDGTKSVTLAGSWNKGSSTSTYITGGSVSSTTVVLPTIPRASTIGAFSCNLESTGTITVTQQSSSFYHKLTYSFQGLTGDISTITQDTSISWKPLANTFIGKITGASATGTITCTTYSNSSGTTVVGTSTNTLTLTIPLATASNTSGTIASSTNVAVSKVHSSIYVTLSYTFGTVTGSFTRTNTSPVSCSWDDTNYRLSGQIPNVTSGTGTLKVSTYHLINGSYVSIGSKSYTLTLSVPNNNSYKPSISAFTLANRSNNNTVQGWNVVLQGYTYLRANATAVAQGGATLTSLVLSGGGWTVSGTSGVISDIDSPVITGTGTITYTLTATDSRGRTATSTINKTVIEYIMPSVSNETIERCDSTGSPIGSGKWALVNYTDPTYTVVGSNPANALTIALQYKLSTASGWTTLSPVTDDGYYNIDISASNNYDARLKISDLINTVYTNAVSLPSDERIININKSGSGLAIGGFNDQSGHFQEYYPAHFYNGVMANGYDLLNGLVYKGVLDSTVDIDDMHGAEYTGYYAIRSSLPTHYPESGWTWCYFIVLSNGEVTQQYIFRPSTGFIARHWAGNPAHWYVWHYITTTHYVAGDTLITSAYTDLNGFITSSTTSCSFSFYTPKSLANISTVTVTAFKGTLRGGSGYLDGKTSAYDWFADASYTLTATKITDNMIRIVCTKSSAFTNVTNNTPVSYYGSLGLSFSTT